MSVGIYIRIRTADGSYPFASVFKTSNGKLRPFYALVKGKPEHHPEGVYHVRHVVNGKRVWEKVGTDPAAAVATAMRRQADKMDGSVTTIEASPISAAHPHLQHPSARYRKTVASAAHTGVGHPLLDSVRIFLTEIKAHKMKKTYAAYAETLERFLRFVTIQPFEVSYDKVTLRERKYKVTNSLPHVNPEHLSIADLEDITREHMMGFILYLKKKGNGERTQFNRVDFFQFFLHHFKLPSLLIGKDMPKYVEKKVCSCDEDAIIKMLKTANEDEKDLLMFFLCAGLREQEAEFACWPDVSLSRATHTVTAHPDLGFLPKDKEEGSIPLPPVLVERLRARQKRYPRTRLIFPATGSGPDGHLLREDQCHEGEWNQTETRREFMVKLCRKSRAVAHESGTSASRPGKSSS